MPAKVLHADWGSSQRSRWVAEARLVGGSYHASSPRPVPDPAGLLAGKEPRVVGFDFPIGIPLTYARLAGVDDFLRLLPTLGAGAWARFFEPAERPEEITLTRPFYPRRPGQSKQAHLVEGLGVSSMNDLRRECDLLTPERGQAEVIFWTLGPKQVGRAAITGWRDVIVPNLDTVRLWPFHGRLSELMSAGGVVVCETYPSEFYSHFGLPRAKTPAARADAGDALLAVAEHLGVRLDDPLKREISLGFAHDDAYDAFVGLLGMLNVVARRRDEGHASTDEVQRVEGWILGQEPPPIR